LSSKHVKNVTINTTNENASLPTTTTTSSSLAIITLDELTTESSFSTSTNVNDLLPSDTSQVPTDEKNEYM
jgi:hypothetical protein